MILLSMLEYSSGELTNLINIQLVSCIMELTLELCNYSH